MSTPAPPPSAPGGELLLQLARPRSEAGTTPDKVSDEVAQALPHLVNEATPQGQVPPQGQDPFSKGVDAVRNMFAGR